MKNGGSVKVICMAVAAIAVLSMSFPDTAEAGRNFQRGGHYSTGKGRTGTFQTQGTRQRGAWSKNQSVSTDRGRNYNRSVDGAYDRKTKTTDRTVQGWSGRTHTTTSTYDRKTQAFNGIATGQNGNTLTANGMAGGGHREGTYETSTGKNGTYEYNRDRNDDGTWTKSNTVTYGEGKTYTTSDTYGYDKETQTLSNTHTGPKGHTRSGSVTFDMND